MRSVGGRNTGPSAALVRDVSRYSMRPQPTHSAANSLP